MRFDETRPFGVEIEAYNVGRTRLVNALCAAGIITAEVGYSHNVTSYWKIVHDNSIHGPQPFELVSPKLYGTAGLAQVEQVMTILRGLGAQVNRSCGLHVHHSAEGMSSVNHRNVGYAYNYYYELFRPMFPLSRQNNTYCRTSENIGRYFDSQTYRRNSTAYLNESRYQAVNLTSILRHGTIEFRQHAGTLNGGKATAWIVFTQMFMSAALKWSKKGMRSKADHYNRQRRFKTFLGLYSDQNGPEPIDPVVATTLRYMQRHTTMRFGRLLAAREVA